jgi:hypothetical protein
MEESELADESDGWSSSQGAGDSKQTDGTVESGEDSSSRVMIGSDDDSEVSGNLLGGGDDKDGWLIDGRHSGR